MNEESQVSASQRRRHAEEAGEHPGAAAPPEPLARALHDVFWLAMAGDAPAWDTVQPAAREGWLAVARAAGDGAGSAAVEALGALIAGIRSPVVRLAGLADGMRKVTGAGGAEWEHWASCIREAAEELAGLLPENREACDAS